MFKAQTSLAILVVAALSMPAFAQDTETETEAPQAEAEAPRPVPSGAEALDLGQAVEAEPKLGERYSKQKFGAWDLACIKTEAETDPCSLLQILKDESGNAVAEVSIFRIANGGQAAAGATIVVPLETLLPAQLTIAVDEGAGKRYNYSFCNPIGCVAQIGLTEEDIAAFKKGNGGKVSLVPAPAPDQVVSLNMSLVGFTAGYNVVDVVEN